MHIVCKCLIRRKRFVRRSKHQSGGVVRGSDVTPSGERADGIMDPDVNASQPHLADRIEAILGIDPDADAIEFGGAWTTWRSLTAAAHGVADHLNSVGLAPGAPVGLVLRNDPAMIAA